MQKGERQRNEEAGEFIAGEVGLRAKEVAA
jgi:hypothetical protein